MGIIDEIIRQDIRQQPITILRTPTNIETYGIIEITGIDVGRRRLDPYYDHEHVFRMPSDCGVVNGDLLVSGDAYYLVMSVEEKHIMFDSSFFKCMTYKCNSIVSIYSYDATTQKYSTLSAENVRCLITQVRTVEWPEDKALLVSKYRGRSQPFQVFMQANAGLYSGADCILVDQENRRFRISKQVDVFIAEGIAQTEVMWER